MKTLLVLLIFTLQTSLSFSKQRVNTELSGIITSLQVHENKAILTFKGIGQYLAGDKASDTYSHPLALRDTKIQVFFDESFKGMQTYSKFRYNKWLNTESAKTLLSDLQKNKAEVWFTLDSSSLTFSKTDDQLKLTHIIGKFKGLSLWKNCWNEPIEIYFKDHEVKYRMLMDEKPTLESKAP